jgi:hypothetical protein
VSLHAADPARGNKLHLIDAPEAVEVMERGIAAEKKQSPKSKRNGFFAMNSSSTKPEFYRDRNGELKFR